MQKYCISVHNLMWWNKKLRIVLKYRAPSSLNSVEENKKNIISVEPNVYLNSNFRM